jgi:hypothetical protein
MGSPAEGARRSHLFTESGVELASLKQNDRKPDSCDYLCLQKARKNGS